MNISIIILSAAVLILAIGLGNHNHDVHEHPAMEPQKTEIICTYEFPELEL